MSWIEKGLSWYGDLSRCIWRSAEFFFFFFANLRPEDEPRFGDLDEELDLRLDLNCFLLWLEAERSSALLIF